MLKRVPIGREKLSVTVALFLTSLALHGQKPTAGNKKIVPISDLPGWSLWERSLGSVDIEYRWRLFNADIKPGCGLEWRSRHAESAFTVDAVIGEIGKAGAASLIGGQELMGDPTGGVLAGQNGATGKIPLHFALFGDGKTVSYYDLH